jgi:protein O-GlcNAc transferase
VSILFSLLKDLLIPRKPQQADARLIQDSRTADKIGQLMGLVEANPGRADLLFNLGAAFETQDPDKAFECYRQAVATAPGYYPARISLLHHLQRRCEWGNLKPAIQKIRKVVREGPATQRNHPSPFMFLALPGTTPHEQKRCAEKYIQLECPPQTVSALRDKLAFDSSRPPNEKIHIGYLSEDFRQHAVSHQMVEVIERRDRSRFHITAFSYGPDDGSRIRKRIEKAFDSFVDITDKDHEDAAREIHSRHIDILVDLTAYAGSTRSAVLALRPAPIQVNFLGYPGTMGADFVDYLIADKFIIPAELQRFYTEKVVWLPDCYMPNDRSRPLPSAPSRAECGLPENGFVFCCFNQSYKFTPEVFDIWCRLLKSVPDSVLWLSAPSPVAETNLRREAETRGVSSERIIMANKLETVEAHLARLQCADLFLDTLPYNAHATCSDALWMGLPVITCAGETFPSRVAGSMLTAMGVPELITYNLNDYHQLALDLANDRNRLDSIRRKIVANRDSSPLFDSEKFTRNLERAYVQMISQAESGATSRPVMPGGE